MEKKNRQCESEWDKNQAANDATEWNEGKPKKPYALEIEWIKMK